MTLDTAIARFRRRETALFRSTVVITRAASVPTFNPVDGSYTEVTTTVYDGAAMVRPRRAAREVEAGEEEVQLSGFVAKLPSDLLVAHDDLLVVTESPDAGMVGRTFRVTDVPVDDWQVNRRLMLEDVDGA